MDRARFVSLRDDLQQQGIDVEAALQAIQAFMVETPSWGYGNSGTRFKVFPWPGAARTLFEKLDDAAMVQRVTGACPGVAIHIPWDRVDDWPGAEQHAASLGVHIGAVNPNLFQDDVYRLGSLCHPDAAVRRRAIDHVLECIRIAEQVHSEVISLWLADGTNYPGQDDVRRRRHRLLDALQEIYAAMPAGMRLLIEYKFFEPAFYQTDLPDWGTSLLCCQKLGPQAQVLVDTGHHPQGTNLAQIVAQLLDEGRLGGFHFNDRKYADDDLIVGSLNPFELFTIFHEILAARDEGNTNVAQIAYMIDQSHNIEPKIEAMIQSIVHIQLAYAKALLVDQQALARAQEAGDVLGAYRVLRAAFETDVRPLLAEARIRQGLDPDPIAAFRQSGYAERVASERALATVTSGYPGA
ncbi:MAG TPA: L-rhamnose isomerase [Ktedonobacterales bacterium]|nr:L-rhamnose isomerase [Ktedonobacterales bacterium]